MLEVESGGCIFRCRKNQTNERKTSTLYSLLKTVLPWRSTDAITGHQLRADAGDIAHRHRSAVDVQDSASLFALPCSRFLVPCSTILSPRSVFTIIEVSHVAWMQWNTTTERINRMQSTDLPVVQKVVTLS